MTIHLKISFNWLRKEIINEEMCILHVHKAKLKQVRKEKILNQIVKFIIQMTNLAIKYHQHNLTKLSAKTKHKIFKIHFFTTLI